MKPEEEYRCCKHQIISTHFWKQADLVSELLTAEGIDIERIDHLDGMNSYYSIGVKEPGDFVRAVRVMEEHNIVKGYMIPDCYGLQIEFDLSGRSL